MLSFSPPGFQGQNENSKHGAEQNAVQIPLQNKVTKSFKSVSVPAKWTNCKLAQNNLITKC